MVAFRRHVIGAALRGAQLLGGLLAITLLTAPVPHEEMSFRERIRTGRALEVLVEIERLARRDPPHELTRGHALAALHRSDEAMRAWLAAAKGGAIDDDLRSLVLARLEDDDPASAIAILRTWPEPSIENDLAAVANEGAWWPRHRALALLEERKALALVDLEVFAVRNLEEADSCARKKTALEMLRRHARTTAAIQALQRAHANDDGCLRRLLPIIDTSTRARLGDAPASPSATCKSDPCESALRRRTKEN